MFWSKPEGPHQIIIFLVSSQTALHNFWSILQSKWGKTLYHSSPSTQPLKPLTMVWQDSEVWLKRLSSTKLETVIALSSAKERKKKPAVNIVSFIFGAPCSPIHKEPLSPSSSIRGSQLWCVDLCTNLPSPSSPWSLSLLLIWFLLLPYSHKQTVKNTSITASD